MCAFSRPGLALAIVLLLFSSVSGHETDKVLLEETRLDFVQTPLLAVLSFVADRHDVQITIDVRTDVNQAITLRDSTGSLGELLKKLLTPLGLRYRTDAQAITVEPIDPPAYFLKFWEKQNEERKILGLSPMPKPKPRGSSQPKK